ncbi:MAG: type III pantothenate kinase, partial [Anaerolineae bacterium]|nr:type III pantothenate kinase [Anaerolineae bacterium]
KPSIAIQQLGNNIYRKQWLNGMKKQVLQFKQLTGIVNAIPTWQAYRPKGQATFERFAEMIERYLNIKPVIVTNKTDTGIKIAIDQPEQAGADRIINAAAVVKLYGGPALVIDFGTATTFDVVSADGAYCGGAISPGIGVAHDALVSRAARLHKVDLQPPPDPIGGNTIHAMQSGIFWGYVALVEGLVTRIKKSMVTRGFASSEADIQVIATGGLSALFQSHSDCIHKIAPELTLDGLRIIYERQAK